MAVCGCAGETKLRKLPDELTRDESVSVYSLLVFLKHGSGIMSPLYYYYYYDYYSAHHGV